MSIEQRIEELTKAIVTLTGVIAGAKVPSEVVADAQPAEKPKYRTTPVTQADIDAAAEETERRAADKKAKAAAAKAKAAEQAKAVEADRVESDEVNASALRETVRGLIYKVDAEKGRPEATKLLAKFKAKKLSEVADDQLQDLHDTATELLSTEESLD